MSMDVDMKRSSPRIDYRLFLLHSILATRMSGSYDNRKYNESHLLGVTARANLTTVLYADAKRIQGNLPNDYKTLPHFFAW